SSCVLLCPLVSSCVLLCPLVSSCVLLCPLVSSCVLLCPLVSSCVLLCPLVSSCVLLCPLVSSCVLSTLELAPRQRLAYEAADPTEQNRQQVKRTGHQDDGRAGRHAGVEREQQPHVARDHAACCCDDDHQRDVARPESAGRGRQHHDADREQRAERTGTRDQVDHHHRP